MNSPFLSALNWRYATKRMNGQKIPSEIIGRITEAARLAPSSYGLQPYSLLVVENPELRDRVYKLAANQPQLTEASHLLVFAVWDQFGDQDVDSFMELIARERSMPLSDLGGYAETIKGTLKALGDAEAKRQWASRQAYIALGTVLAAAAMERVDATPMEGFDPQALDQVLGLRDMNLRSVVITTLGYRDTENDGLASLPKVRWPRASFCRHLG